MDNPFAYPLCSQTVTVYRKSGTGVTRRVQPGCFYRYEDVLLRDERGSRFERKCLLIQPGEDAVCPGDRIFDGVGPEITAAQWEEFLPVNVPGLSQVEYATPRYWEGRLCHTEAGRK